MAMMPKGETTMFKRGDRVFIINSTMSGKPIYEGVAKVVRKGSVEGQYVVRFANAGLGDPGRYGVERFVVPEAQEDPWGYVQGLVKEWEAR